MGLGQASNLLQTLSLLTSLKLLGLSTRETEVLFWAIQGKDNQAIAKHLSVHVSTVRKHLESVYRKLGVQSRSNLPGIKKIRNSQF